MEFSAIIGAWVAAFLTIGIFSYLYKDNPFYKAAEHLFVGVSAGYLLSLGFWTQLQPNLFGRLFPAKHYDPDTITYTIYNVLSFFYCGAKFNLYSFCFIVRIWFCMGKSFLC